MCNDSVPFFEAPHGTLFNGDALAILRTIPSKSVQCCVTSPPYWGLRDYGVQGQIGLEPTIQDHIAVLVAIFKEVHRVLKDHGTLWLNYADTFAGSGKGRNADGSRGCVNSEKQATNCGSTSGTLLPRSFSSSMARKNLLGVPWRLAFALQDAGWILRSDIIWHKPNAMPESVKDRPTRSHEYIFLFSKKDIYFYDWQAVSEPIAALSFYEEYGAYVNGKSFSNSLTVMRESHGNVANLSDKRNRRSVWSIPTSQCAEAHFATFPKALAEVCIKAGSSPSDIVLDPFMGSGTTGMVARDIGRKWVGIELNLDYCNIALKRIDAHNKRLTDMLLEGI